MELKKYLSSSAIRFAQITDDGKTHLPDLIDAIKERYRFWVFPRSPEQWDMEAGAVFSRGRFADSVIQSMKVYTNGVVVQSDLDTDSLDAMIDDMAVWLSEEHGVLYSETKPVPKAFTSSMEVKPSVDVLQGMRRFEGLAASLTAMLAEYGFSTGPAGVASVMLNTDPTLSRPIQPTRFLFERRVGAPYEDAIFYSEAPVSSSQHLALLTELELAFRSGQ